MRIAGAVRTIFLLAISSSTILFAQFQQPTADELSMTSDPKAPGASAVYLNIEEITNDPKHFRSFSARIKVLTEKGKQLATIQLPYDQRGFKITDIKGRTIHPDGTIVPMTVKAEDLLITKAGDGQFERKVFTLPSVEVGSILEYHYDLEYEDNQYSSPQWEIQKPYFVHKAHYSFIPFNAFQKGSALPSSQYLVDGKGHTLNTLMWWPILPPGVTLQNNVLGTFSLDVTDIPPIPSEEWMPPSATCCTRCSSITPMPTMPPNSGIPKKSIGTRKSAISPSLPLQSERQSPALSHPATAISIRQKSFT